MIGAQEGTFDFTLPKRPIRKMIKCLLAFTLLKAAHTSSFRVSRLAYLAALAG